MASHAPPARMPASFGGLAANQPSGLPAPLSLGFGCIAVVVALVFDVVFLKIHVPGIGGYAWYLTTALSFAGAGWASIAWTRAGRGLALTGAVIAAVLYGMADLALGLVLEDLPMNGAISLGAQGLVIALICGAAGVRRALAHRDD